MDFKKYQKATIDTLANFLREAKTIGNAAAFYKHRNAPSYPREYSPLPRLDDAP